MALNTSALHCNDARRGKTVQRQGKEIMGGAVAVGRWI